jgi:serine/threonine protein kinase
MSKILSQGGYGCVYYPGIKCNGNTNPDQHVVTKLQKNDDTAQNEIAIGEMIKKITNFNSYFIPVVKNCEINLSQIDHNVLEKCKVITPSEDINYIIMDLPYINGVEFFDFMTALTTKKSIIFNLLETFQYLLVGLEYLLIVKVVHFDLKGQNILYNNEIKLPVIIDFGLSFNIEQITDANIEQYFYIYAPDYYLWPMEVHFINYLLHKSNGSLSEEHISEIIQRSVDNNVIFEIFSDNFKTEYINAAKEFFQQFVNQPKKNIIDSLLTYYKTWDNYALSIMYLKILDYVFSEGFHENKLIIYFSQLLLFNISFDPNKRLTLEETTTRFKKIFFFEDNESEFHSLIKRFNYNSDLITKKNSEDILKTTP